jgi:thymidylate kinase
MALVREYSLKKLEKNRNSVHEEVEATYSIFKDKNNEKYFTINTYGSSERKVKGVPSQSLQLDRNAAKKLIEILSKEYL